MLRTENLSKTFLMHHLAGKRISGFANISLHVPEGGSLGITGPSGSGKSSVLKCIYRTYLCTSGQIWFRSARFGPVNLASAAVNVISAIRESEIGSITQFLKVIPRVTALDVVAAPLLRHGTRPAQARTKASELLEQLEIPGALFDAYPATFSGGEQQRVNIARAVIKAPRLLLMDEPTASLDPRTTSMVLDILADLRRRGTTMIGIFHQPETLKEFSDAIFTMPNSPR
jgi:alpha-D-ribose 1-methylphosphonate 5-triphosphate synthase subunit PhnL